MLAVPPPALCADAVVWTAQCAKSAQSMVRTWQVSTFDIDAIQDGDNFAVLNQIREAEERATGETSGRANESLTFLLCPTMWPLAHAEDVADE